MKIRVIILNQSRGSEVHFYRTHDEPHLNDTGEYLIVTASNNLMTCLVSTIVNTLFQRILGPSSSWTSIWTNLYVNTSFKSDQD